MSELIIEICDSIVQLSVTAWDTLVHPTFLLFYAATAIFLLLDANRRGWKNCLTRRMFTGIGASFLIIALNGAFVPILLIWVDTLAAAYDSLGIPHLPESTWAGIPIVVMAIVGVIFIDLADYINHRLMHTKWLWPMHAMHHSDQEVNGLTTFRVHLLEVMFMKTTYIVLLTWLGVPAEAQALGAAAVILHNIYVHSRLEWTHGPFRLLIASPNFHLWHHADLPEAHGKNLANIMPLWDWLGGTYVGGTPNDVPTGAKGVSHADVVSLMAYPFLQWARTIRSTLRKARAS